MKHSIALFSTVAIIMLLSAALVSEPRMEEKEKGKTWNVIVDRVPATLDEFRSFRDRLAKTPQGGIVVYLAAHLVMIGNPDLGEQCLVLSLDRSQLAKSPASSRRRPSVEGWQLGASEAMKLGTSGFLKDRSYAAKSFVEGTSTGGGYGLPPLPYRYVIRAHSFQDADLSTWKGLASTSCHDLGYVPIIVKKNNTGIWKVVNSSSFYSGCKDPVFVEKDDL